MFVQSARFVAEQAVQLHGAMGVTDEIGVGRCLKRLLTIDALFGNAERHFSQMATAPIEGGQAAE